VTRWTPEGAGEETEQAVSRLAAALLACVEGQVSFFQGEELGLPDADYEYDEIKDPQGLMFWPRGRGRDPIRHPFPWDESADGGFTSCGEPWLPTKDDVAKRHAAGQEDDPGSVLNCWRRLIGLRRETPALKWGEMRICDAGDESGLLRFERHLDGDIVEAALNLGPEPLRVPRPEGTLLDGEEGERLPGFGWRIVMRSS
jgi:alpha-glucosidase